MSVSVRQAAAADLTAVRDLCWAYRDVLVERSAARPAIVDAYYAKADYGPLMARLPELHARPDGAIFVAELNGAVIGCAMTHRIDTDTCEIKRVFVDPAGRGAGAAKALVRTAMDQARADGYTRMVLDTMIWLGEAVRLYEGMGFTPCAPYYEPPPEFIDLLLFLEHPL